MLLQKKRYNFLLYLTLLLTLSCTRDKQDRHLLPGDLPEIQPLTEVRYAKRFNISYFKEYKLIQVNNPWPGSSDTLTYLVSQNQQVMDAFRNDKGVKVIQQPLSNIVCFSTTHLPYLEFIQEEDKLCGFPTTDYIYSESILERVRSGAIKDLGPSNEINLESLLALAPDLVFAFSMGNELSMIQKIELSGIPVVLNADYLENHPLGRAEWIKFMAAFFDKDLMADSLFTAIERAYLETKRKMDNIHIRPTIFTGVVYGDAWFMPGGNHYGTQFFRDAGGDYVWADDASESILQLSFEVVYQKAGSADYWVGTATYNSLTDIEQADSRYRDFKAYRTGNVYNYSARVNEKGGNAYFELGYARPDIILKDLAKILHPEEMEEHQFYFYKKLY